MFHHFLQLVLPSDPSFFLSFLIFLPSCLSQCSTAAKRHHNHGTSNKGLQLIEAGLQFRDSVYHPHGQSQGSTQADTVLEKAPSYISLAPIGL